MPAWTGERISELPVAVIGSTGRLYAVESNRPATTDLRIIVPQRAKAMIESDAAPCPVVQVTECAGTKVCLEHDDRALL